MRLTMSARFTALHRPFSISQICVPKAHASTHIVGGSDSNERKICGWEKSKSAIKEQRRDREITAMHDAAVLCRNYRGDIIHFLADSMDSMFSSQGGLENNSDANAMFPTSKFLVDLLPNVLEEDDEIFEAALGLGDFDEEWENKRRACLA